jgi:hypothetical protein
VIAHLVPLGRSQRPYPVTSGPDGARTQDALAEAQRSGPQLRR